MAELIHVWSRCHACGTAPIVGRRWSCQTCPAGPDNDLCEACHRSFEQGGVQHPPPEAREAPPGRHVFRVFEGVAREQVAPWLAIPWSNATTPAIPDRFVVRPEFRSGRESFFGSYGFIVAAQDGGPPLMLTALHVLDELAKFKGIDCTVDNAAYTGTELPPCVTGVQLYDPFAPNWMLAELGTAGAMLCLPDARICPEEPYSQRDVAAFRVVAADSVRPARLAAVPPVVGEPIWLVVHVGRGARERAIPAIVVEMTEQTLIFRFAKGVPMPAYTSGAPLLNRLGEVVGLNIGGGMLDGHRIGHASHVASMRHYLGW
jgi:hypothetical protein